MHKVKPYQVKNPLTGKVIEGYFSCFVGKAIETTTDPKGKTYTVLQNGNVRAMFEQPEIETVASR